jgi:Fe-S cluster biogenesis protein NfuA
MTALRPRAILRAVQARIEAALHEYVRPMLEADGGRVELVSVDGDTILLRFSGQCAGCPGQPYTLAGIVEPVLQRLLGDQIRVQALP